MSGLEPRADRPAPLVVDLDGTLIRTDLLVEALLVTAGHRPVGLLSAFRVLATSGRGALKAHLARVVDLDVVNLPYRQEVIDYLVRERAKGREIALVSASAHSLVERVARHLDLFDWCQGSTPGRNLKGRSKARWLRERLPGGFAYAGDSAADLEVWRVASAAVPVGTAAATRRRLPPESVEARFDDVPAGLRDWVRALRLHQWSKNALILIPLFLSGQFLNPPTVLSTLAGFVLFGLVASGGYLVNDLLDLQADRRHQTKRERPLPAGRIGLLPAAGVAAACVLAGLGGLLALSVAAAGMAAVYLAGALAYSLVFKRFPFVDLFVLASLFTLRLAIGTALIGAEHSTWLLAFSMFFFFSLSAIKRAVELQRLGDTSGLRRGYRGEDLGIVQSFGVAFSAGSLIIFVLYLEDEALVRGPYASPEWLWVAPAVILLWLCRLWAIASRGELHDDPVVFALSDRVSLAIAAVLGLAVLAAHLL